MRRIVICSDGTWNTPDQRTKNVPCPTNVVKLARAVLPLDAAGVSQLVYYDQGVGTGNLIDRITGGAFGEGLSQNVCDGYRFLVDNYVPGDEIYLFGFSRGAYTSRSLGGLIRKCGILKKEHGVRIPEAYDLYRKRDASADTDDAKAFRSKFSHAPGVVEDDPWGVKIRCIGVWDTVGQLGVPGGLFRSVVRSRYEFHDVQLSSRVENAFQALAIDELRGLFEPSLWTTKPGAIQRVEQVWFAGSHSDVGGGVVFSGLADLALAWMYERVATCGLRLDPRAVAGLEGDPAAEIHESRFSFYRLLAPHVRVLGETPTETVHESVYARMERRADYRPANLARWVESHPRPSDVALAEAAGTPRIPIAAQDPKAAVTPARDRSAASELPPPR